MDLIGSSLSGSFHQGSIEQFGVSAGMQCSYNALYPLVCSILKSSLNWWDSRDLEVILLNGDMLLKAQDKPYFLSVLDLPQRFPVGKSECLVEYQDNYFSFIMSAKCYIGLANELSSSFSASTGIVFFIAGLCLGVMSSKGYIYLFDSHSRDSHGRHIQDGTSVLLRFKNMLDLSKHIISTYFAPPLISLQFEIQFVNILMDNLSFSQKTLKAFRR